MTNRLHIRIPSGCSGRVTCYGRPCLHLGGVGNPSGEKVGNPSGEKVGNPSGELLDPLDLYLEFQPGEAVHASLKTDHFSIRVGG